MAVGIYYDGDSTAYGISCVGGEISGDLNSDGHDVVPGTGVWAQQPDNEPATIQRKMDEFFGAGAVWVENHGVGGQTILDSINGSGGYSTSQPSFTKGFLGKRVQSSSCSVFVGKFLTNDRYRMTPAQFGNYCRVWINTVRGNLNALGKASIPVLAESNPICRLDAPDAAAYLDQMHRVCASENVMCMPQHEWIVSNLPDWRTYLPDSVHPNSALLKIMGERSAAFLKGTVGGLL